MEKEIKMNTLFKRMGWGELLAGISGLLLIIALFTPWYG